MVDLLMNVKVLCVEDEAIARNHLNKVLKKHVGKVCLADNGLKGIETFREEKPDIVITDLVMPELGGLEMVKHLRDEGETVPVIVISSLSDISSILETVDLGIEKYIIKPFNVDELLDTLSKVAKKIYLKKNGELLLNENQLLDRDSKLRVEREVRNIYGKFLKDLTGHGAEKIVVFFKGNRIEVSAENTLTKLEHNLIKAGYNPKMVDMSRMLLYEKNKSMMETEISALTASQFILERNEVDSEKGKTTLVFKSI